MLKNTLVWTAMTAFIAGSNAVMADQLIEGNLVLTSYIESYELIVKSEQVKSGTEVYKLSDGTCKLVKYELLEIRNEETEFGPIQMPKVTKSESQIACPS